MLLFAASKKSVGRFAIAVSTTVVAFAPLLFVTGIIGKFIAVMPQAVIAILVVSLFEALMILPAHLEGALTGSLSKAGKITSWHEDLRNRVEKGLNHVINHYYHSAVTFVVKNRYFSFAIGIGVLIISLGVVIGGYVPFVFFPKAESDWVIAEVSYPLEPPLN